MGHLFVMRVSISYFLPFILESVPSTPKILSLVNGEKYYVMCVEQVIGDEKYECDMLNIFVMESRRFCGRVCCDTLKGILWYVRMVSLV